MPRSADEGHPLVIPDLTQDPRTRRNTLVTGAPHLRFYAGARLETPEGHALGTLCVIDSQPRHWTSHQIQLLSDLAASVVTEIRKRPRCWLEILNVTMVPDGCGNAAIAVVMGVSS